METKIIKVTDKGQISLPVGMRESLKIRRGDELFITKNEDFSPVKAVILKHQGAITQERTPQKISLSYPIKKQEQGFTIIKP